MPELVLSVFSEETSNLMEFMKQVTMTPGVERDDVVIYIDEPCPECGGDVIGRIADGEWVFACVACDHVISIS